MKNMIDLHLHTTASDGADTAPELLEQVRTAGLRIFSVTDHDTIDGALEMEALVPEGLHYIRGIEFSCITPLKKCHILGYGFDPNDAVFREALELGVRLRQEKLERRLDVWKDRFGIVLTPEEDRWLRSQNSPGKPHFGTIIKKRGLETDLRTAIKNYVNPCKLGNDRIDANMAVRAIVHAGGIPVWAHPLGGENEERLTQEEFRAQLELLMACGIRGLECHYSRYSREDAAYLVEQANAHGLWISGGSDYHGSNKPNLHPGKLSEENDTIPLSALNIYPHLPG